MMRSLFAGVTGLRTHQTRMDVIGNNIANVNTLGYKKSSVTFKDLYSETVSASAAPSGDGSTGGINPKQIGLGVTLNSITTIHTPGSAQYTGNPMDVAISGDGYFAVLTPTGYKYTRSGNFALDTAGNLVTAQGYYVQTVNPTMSSDTMLINNGVKTDGLLVANSVFSAPVSNIHTGNVTADLAEAMGREFGFAYVLDGSGYKADINKNYQLGVSDSLYTLDESLGGLANKNLIVGKKQDTTTKELNAVTLNMQSIADAYLREIGKDDTYNPQPGNKTVEFRENPVTGTTIDLLVDGVLVGQATGIASKTGGTATEGASLEVEIAFTDLDGGDLGTIVITELAAPDDPDNPTTWSLGGISQDDQLRIAESLSNIPAIPLEESGKWWLMSNGEQIEQVAFDGKMAASGAGLASGDILFTTASYGAFRLKLDTPIESMKALSSELNSAKFTIDIQEEPYVIYESPTGEIAPNMLNTLTVDFSRYGNLSIDSKGAVIAQLMHDEILTVDGREVNMKMGDKVVLGYIPLANFNNTSGLEKIGDNLYEVGADSGAASYSMPGSGTAGGLSPSSQEMSNVDLSEEMVSMIITQRGFQANSRIITVSDTMLEELINLKR